MHYLNVLTAFLSASLQEEMAYRSNFVISLFNSLLALAALLAITSFVVASWLFRRGLRRYDSTSS